MNHSETFLRLADEAKARIREISPTEAAEEIRKGAVPLDVREKDEYESGHLIGATHLGRGVLEMKIEELVPDKSTPIVCYCAGGNRGALAADTLQRMGYANVQSIQGGLNACPLQTSKTP